MSVKFDNVTITYDTHPAVHHLSGEFKPGSMTAIVGPNGAGKTTIIKAIAGLHKPSEGRINNNFSAKNIAYIPQQANIQRDFPINVIDFVKSAYIRKAGFFRKIDDGMNNKAVKALMAVGLKDFETRQINSLSAGQFQRVLFARAIIQEADLILLDEPFNAIDAKTTSDLLLVMSRWSSEEKTIIAVIHDLDIVKQNFPNTLLFARECIGWGSTEKFLTSSNMLKARSMMEAWDEKANICAA